MMTLKVREMLSFALYIHGFALCCAFQNQHWLSSSKRSKRINGNMQRCHRKINNNRLCPVVGRKVESTLLFMSHNQSDEELIKATRKSFYVITFPSLYGTQDLTRSAKALKSWKQYCLGDGGVYFDQRPNTLNKLNSALCSHIQRELRTLTSQSFDLECTVLSTCARFEILFVISSENEAIAYEAEMIKTATTDFLAWQISHRQHGRIIYFFKRLLPFSFIDKPSRIGSTNESNLNRKQQQSYEMLSKSLQNEIIHVSGIEEVSKRLCLIASGLLDRRVFRPFSARDQHVMKQLKTTIACAKGVMIHGSESNEKTVDSLKIIFDSALLAGKGARSPKTVPILEQLRQESSGADGPVVLSREAAESAKKLAVDPAVRACVANIKARQVSQSIVLLKDKARELAENEGIQLESNDGLPIRSLLHQPIMDLRNGDNVDIDSVLKRVESRLKHDKIKC